MFFHITLGKRFHVFRVSHCFAVEEVTLQNTRGLSHEEVDEITSLTTAQENSTNCEMRVGNSRAHIFFL